MIVYLIRFLQAGLVLFVYSMNVIAEDELFAHPERVKQMLKSGKLDADEIPNPHWLDDACIACHKGNGGFSKSNIRSHNMDVLCGNCHNEYGKKNVFVHPTGIKISKKMRKRMPKKFQQSLAGVGAGYTDSKMSCLTCHDLPMQCIKKRRHEKTFNSGFYRTGPFRNRTELCFYCHDKKSYQRFSPHEQIKNGKIKKELCIICHVKTDNLHSSSRLKDVHFQAKKDVTRLCTNCHTWRPHPGGDYNFGKKKMPDHLVKPSAGVLRQMKVMRKKTGVDLPLEKNTGKVHCATCHNPHAKNVIRLKSINTGAGSRNRLRMKKLCEYCHDF